VSLDFEFDDAQQAMAAAVAQFCHDQYDPLKGVSPGAAFPRELWRALASLDVFALAIPGGGGGAVEVAALMEALGRAGFPGPLAGTFLAVRLLPEPLRACVARGDDLVCVGTPPLLPFAPLAAHFVELDLAHARAWLARPRGAIVSVETLGGEPWGRIELLRDQELPNVGPALAFSELAAAAYLTAAGQRLVEVTADHARTRRQFDRTIGEFQAVAHPLADCAIRLAAARGLTRTASARFDTMDRSTAHTPESVVDAAAARLSAVAAALNAAHVCTQAFGAMGVLREGPIFYLVRQIRQMASSVPGGAGARERIVESLGFGSKAA